ncbi:MAG TPA: cobalamin B12-binding domain-containing protein, partial [Spirochaetota bacterium]|nr:cobalamin B12-binding domain-containing protein [Spirochaetota bacterium]
MKVMFLALNARYYHSNLAFRYLRQYLKKTNADVVLEELTISTPLREIVKCIYDHSPDALFISVYIWNSLAVKMLLREVESLMKCRIYLGGPEVSFNAEEWIGNFPEITVIAHAGEESVRKIIDSKCMNEEKIISEPNPPFDEIPFPYTEEELSSAENKILYYESSRGCAFSCS